MSNLEKIKKYGIAYIYSGVLLEKNEEYLIPFDGNGIPMKYEELKELSENLKTFLSKITKEDYENFYDRRIEYIEKKEEESSEYFRQKRYEEKKEEDKKYIENFDYNISKPILQEKEIEKILKKMTFYSSDFIDTREIKYPVIVNFYKNKILLKTVNCSKNLAQTLMNVKKLQTTTVIHTLIFLKNILDKFWNTLFYLKILPIHRHFP